MISCKRLGGAAAVFALVAGPVIPTPAQAATSTVTDASSDATYTPSDDASAVTAAPDEELTDVVQTTMNYKKRYLVAVIEARDAGQMVFPWVRVRGGGSDITYVGVGGSGGQVKSFKTRNGEPGATKAFVCDGDRKTVDKEANTYRLRIPASCFGAPGRIKVGASLGRSAVQDSELRFFTDDTSAKLSTFARPLLTSTLRRG